LSNIAKHKEKEIDSKYSFFGLLQKNLKTCQRFVRGWWC